MADRPRATGTAYEYAIGRALRVTTLANGTALCSGLLADLTEPQLVTIERAAREVAQLANYYIIEAQTARRRQRAESDGMVGERGEGTTNVEEIR